MGCDPLIPELLALDPGHPNEAIMITPKQGLVLAGINKADRLIEICSIGKINQSITGDPVPVKVENPEPPKERSPALIQKDQ